MPLELFLSPRFRRNPDYAMGISSTCRGELSLFRTVRMLLVAASTLVLAPALHAQDDGPPSTAEISLPPITRAFAIRNARIVQAPGRIIERGTVVARNGVIVAVGAGIPIPPDAQVIEGDSLTVYAGFIDGLSHAGVPKPKDEKPTKVPRPGDPPYDRAGILPARDVRSLLKPDDGSVDSLRMLGFTVARSVPYGQMLPGSSALVLLGGDAPEEMVLRGGSGLFAQFDPAIGDVYPATPMGIMAKWRQLYREASRRRQIQSLYDERPAGLERPPYDETLYAFFPVIEGRTPVVFRAENALEARRAVKLSQELGFPLVIAGLKEGSDLAPELKGKNIPLFLSLDLPRERKEDRNDSAGSKDSTRAADTVHAVTPSNSPFVSDRRTLTWQDVQGEKTRLEARQRLYRKQYYASPARLRRDGLTYGFATFGAKLAEIRENMTLMLGNGLDTNQALAALTVDAARLLGMESSLGTVEPGKMANLVVTDGPYFRRGTQVRYVYVNGRQYRYEAKPAGKDTAAVAGDAASTAGDSLLLNPALTGIRSRNVKGSMLIRNATVLTVTKGTLANTDILVQDGKIAAVGKGLSAPRGVDTIDATGQFVMPGIIDAHSHNAVSGEVNEWTNPVTAEVAIRDVLDPNDINIYRALAGGVTESHIMHGSANVIGGQCQTIKLRYGVTDPSALVMEGAPRTIKFALGENPTRVHGKGFGVQPSTRMGVEMVMRQAFTEAQRYMQAKDRYERTKGEKGAVPPPYDLRMEVLSDILKGNIIVNCHSYRADEILMVMKVFRDFGIKRLVFQHVNEGFKVAPELAAFGAGASVFSDWWAYKFEVYYSTAYNAAILTRNGVVTSINSDSPELDRHLNHEAAKAQRYGGLTPDEALALITINPARQLGIDSRVGSIEVGKDADLAIFSANPLSVYAICQRTIVDGVVRFDRDHDPDDMRIYVDPKGSVEATTVRSQEEEDACMRGTEHLFHQQAE